MRRTWSVLVCVLLLGTAACDGNQLPDTPARRVATLELVPTLLNALQESTLQVRALDSQGAPVEGAVLEVGFAAQARVTATTGADGIASAVLTPAQRGPGAVEVQVQGGKASTTLNVQVVGPRARFTVDSIFLAGIGCAYEFQLGEPIPDRDQFAGYSVDRPGVVRRMGFGMRTGSVGWLYTGVFADAPGAAILVAHHHHGNGYATVRVGNGIPRVEFDEDLNRTTFAVGERAHLTHETYGACDNPLNGRYTTLEQALSTDSAFVRGHTLDPEVVAIDNTRPSYGIGQSITFTGLRPGQARIVATYRGGADTTVVTVN